MVIFHSYVSLPEGITSDYGSFQIIPNHSKSRSPFLLIVLTSFPSFLLKPPLWLTQHLCWLTPHLCWWSRCFWWFWCFVMLWFLAFSSHNFSIINFHLKRENPPFWKATSKKASPFSRPGKRYDHREAVGERSIRVTCRTWTSFWPPFRSIRTREKRRYLLVCDKSHKITMFLIGK